MEVIVKYGHKHTHTHTPSCINYHWSENKKHQNCETLDKQKQTSAQVLFKKGLYYVSFYQQYPVFKFILLFWVVSLMSHKTSTHNFKF